MNLGPLVQVADRTSGAFGREVKDWGKEGNDGTPEPRMIGPARPLTQSPIASEKSFAASAWARGRTWA